MENPINKSEVCECSKMVITNGVPAWCGVCKKPIRQQAKPDKLMSDFIMPYDNRVGLNLPPIPVYSDWECHLLFWTWCPEVGKVPNWFHRKMQTFLVGAKWKKK